jgi:ACT domain-containing protein
MIANSELIYQLTRIVSQHLGERADRKMVEGIVTDVFGLFTATTPASSTVTTPASSTALATSPSGNATATQTWQETISTAPSQRYVISGFGVDRPGIVAAIATLLSDTGCSIVDINQTVVQGKFAMIMIVDATAAGHKLAGLRDAFRQLGEKLGVRIYLQREDIFQAMHRI